MSKVTKVNLASPLGTAAQSALRTASRRSGLLGGLSLSSLVAACVSPNFGNSSNGGSSSSGTTTAPAIAIPTGTYGYTLNGIAAYDESGTSVSSAGDVNGDGYDDLLIGAPYADSDKGETYLVFGGDAAHFQAFDTADNTTQDGVLELNLIA